LFARQSWWVATAIASGGGIFLLVYGIAWIWRVAGPVLLVAPHVIGAPPPPNLDTAYPAGMAGEFVIASLLVSAVVWSLSGLAAGWLHQRLSRAT
jgi:predicted cobalt transporter CbtA